MTLPQFTGNTLSLKNAVPVCTKGSLQRKAARTRQRVINSFVGNVSLFLQLARQPVHHVQQELRVPRSDIRVHPHLAFVRPCELSREHCRLTEHCDAALTESHHRTLVPTADGHPDRFSI